MECEWCVNNEIYRLATTRAESAKRAKRAKRAKYPEGRSRKRPGKEAPFRN